MKAIISVNHKFMSINPKELVEFILNNSKYTKGIEINIDSKNKEQLDYLKKLSIECKNNDFHLQIHGESSLNLEDQIKYMKILENISDNLNYKIHVVLHSKTFNNKEESISKTIEYMNDLIDAIDNEKLIISLENLNSLHNKDRLNKEEITNIVLNNENLYMTYDIGHELIDNGKLIDLNKFLIEEISNVHIHTYDYNYDSGFDHKVILKNDSHWNSLIKIITFLKLNNYNNNVVFEYALDFCEGDTIYEKIQYYLKSIDYVYERIE